MVQMESQWRDGDFDNVLKNENFLIIKAIVKMLKSLKMFKSQFLQQKVAAWIKQHYMPKTKSSKLDIGTEVGTKKTKKSGM